MALALGEDHDLAVASVIAPKIHDEELDEAVAEEAGDEEGGEEAEDGDSEE
jgi:large subunit ribosomal protein L25